MIADGPTSGGVKERIEQLSHDKLNALLKRLRGKGGTAQEIQPVSRDGEGSPLSFAQERLWFLDELQPGGSVYNMPAALRLAGRLDPALLERSLDGIVRRHEVLRTVFSATGGRPVQVVAPEGRLTLPRVDLTALPSAARQDETARLRAAEARRPFDLARGPLLRTVLLGLAAGDEGEHVLLLTFHHIVADAWSLGILQREIAALYQGAELPGLPVQYADYAVWERGRLQGERLAAQLDYWRRQLAGAPMALELPADRPRPPVQTFRGGSRELRLPADVAARLRHTAQREGVTLYMLLLAGFAALLGRLTGREDLLVGTPLANRSRSELQGLIGLFVNTLAVRLRPAGALETRRFLAAVRETVLEGFAHQDLAFDALVEELRPRRDLSRNPVVQVTMAFQPAGPALPAAQPAEGALRLAPLPSTGSTKAKFDLSLTVEEAEEGLTLTAEYAVDLFTPPTVARLLGHYATLLDGVAAALDLPLAQLPLLAAAERHQLLAEWNDTSCEAAGGPWVHEMVAAQARRTPEAPAVVDGARRVSYGELDRRVCRIARELRGLGVGPEVRVGVCLERSPELIAACLGVLQAGGAYIALDPSHPEERLGFQLEDSGTMILLTRRGGLAGLAAARGIRCLFPHELEDDGPALAPPPLAPGNLAYVIYTSGSTGRPKGVELTHGSLLNLVALQGRLQGIGAADRTTVLAGVGFDATILETWVYLAAGASLHIAPEALRSAPEELRDWMVEQGITTSLLPTAVAEALLDLDWSREGTVPRSLMAGGDRLHRFAPEALPFRLINAYGPTEATVMATAGTVPAGGRAGQLPTLGRPLENYRVYVVEAGGEPRPAPVGVPGELLIGGVALARSYLRRPDLTAERFVPDPFAAAPGERLYRTGDLVRWSPEGELEFLGRIDHQVKVRGQRIELGEIEAVLARYPAVREATVLALDGRLVAFLTAADDVSPAELREHARRHLPEVMVPTAFVPLAAWPLTTIGKVDRKTLGELGRRTLAAGGAESGPLATPAQELLAGIWRELLEVERVGRGDNFFELGGHSLKATQLRSRVNAAFGLDLPLQGFFEAQTLESQADLVASALRQGAAAALPIVPVPRGGDLPLSFAQQRLWFLDRMVPDNPFYNIYYPVELCGPLDVGVLGRSFQEIVRRHEVLRTSFGVVAGRPVQVIDPEVRLDIPWIDLQGLSGDRRREELARLSREEGRRPFDLSRSPLVRFQGVRTEPERHTLLITLHHIAADGWSTRVLIDELAALYEAFLAGEGSPLPELPIQYADFAVWQRQWFQGELFQRQLSYWMGRLEGISEAPLELPTDHARPAIETFRGRTEPYRLEAPLVRELNALARRHRATPFMVFLTGFKSLLSRYSGQQDVAVGTGIANRNRREIEDLIGFFVNTLVLRTDLSGMPSFEELLSRVQQTTVESYDHQDLPFEMLVEEMRPERRLNRHPLVQVMLAFQNFPRSARGLRGLSVAGEEVQSETGTAKFDLSLFVFEAGEELSLRLQHSADLFERVTVRRMLGHLETLLRSAAAQPDLPAAELPLLSAAERVQLLREWSDTAVPCPQEPPVHELMSRHARLRPQALAVSGAGWRLSYGELEARSNRLAHHLHRLGVGMETRVAVCMERTPERVIGIAAVLKAGGAYVSLDPAYPKERLAWLLEDAGAPVLLTQGALLDRLPETTAAVLRLDDDWNSVAGREDRAPAGGVLPENLAYVVYTSGSTGRPKGVEVPHAGLMNLVRWHQRLYEVEPGDRGTQVASPAFDASIWEMWPYLAAGASLHIPDEETRLSPSGMVRWWDEQGITLAYLPTPLAEGVLAEPVPESAPVRALIIGGDRLHRRPRPDVRFRLMNHYGPAEYSVTSTVVEVAPGSEAEGLLPTIGRAVDNTSLYVLDRRAGLPLPVGVPGELCVAGVGLARGYLGRPELTAEKFVPDPFAAEPGARMYRTGDLVRWLPDGDLDFLGRLDFQVKLRGMRIEPGEIETVLGQHPAVRDAAVLVREDRPGDKRLVAYVVQKEAGAVAEAPDEQVSQWGGFFDRVYSQEAADPDPTFNIIGWDSTYSGLPIPAEEMREWLDDTVERIQALRPRRVLEIGCGTGMVLFRVAGECESYWGTDVSGEAIEYLERQLAGRPELAQVRLARRSAEQLDGFAPGSLDLVVMNSVAQYFPGVSYLVEVLRRTVAAVRPGGAIFLGDLRSLPLQQAFHTGIELYRAEPDLPLETLRQRVRARSLADAELQLSPALFYALQRELPRISRVEVYPKRGWGHNEMTQFRYQVVLHVEAEPPVSEPFPWLDWRQEGLSLETLRRRLDAERPAALGVRGVPNRRVAEMAEAARLLFAADGPATAARLRERAAAAGEEGIEPQAVWDLARQLSYDVELGWAAPEREGRFDVVLRRRGMEAPGLAAWLPAPEPPAAQPWSAYANDPLQGRFARQVVPELRVWLGERLPDYMVPSAFVLLDALPLTPNGKVDRKALPAPEQTRSPEEETAPPSNPVEELLAGIWTEVLRLDRVGVHDDFFELGGHSLLATQVVSRIREVLGVELPLRRLFTAPTVAGLARAVQEAQGTVAPPVVPVSRSGDLPLSFAQQRLWVIDQLEPGSPAYNVPLAVRLTGEVSAPLLRRIFAEVVRRHEALRTTFVARDGRPVQVIAPPSAPELPVVDLSRLPEAAREARAVALAGDEAVRPFSLERGPLLRLTLVRLAGQEHLLLLTLHHIVSDGWSMGVLIREVAALYAAFSQGLPSPLPELPLHYADFAVWQRGWLQGPVLEAQLEHWKRRLEGAPQMLELPTDRPRPPVQTYRGRTVPFVLPPAAYAGVRELCRREGVTPFMALLAAWAVLLGRHAGQDDLLVGTPIAGRNRREIEELIGFFVNTLVLRADLSGDPSFRRLLGRVRTEALEGFNNQDLPFERLVEELVPERDLARSPLFQVLFVLQNAPVGALSTPGLTLAPFALESRLAKFDLVLSLAEDADGGLAGSLEHSADLFDGDRIVRLLQHLGVLLAAAAADPERPVAELPLLTAAERGRVLYEWNDNAVEQRSVSVHEPVEEQARRTPDALAVLWAGEAGGEEAGLSYRELDERANRLARHLRALGVGPDERVAICLERSLHLPVAVLGVLKAGGAYVPLDPDYPADRVSFMLADSRSRVLVTTSDVAARLAGLDPGVRPVLLDADREAIAARGAGDPVRWATPANLAYVIYTSGSTGRPKGVAMPHGVLANLLAWQRRSSAAGPGSRTLQFASLSFDVSFQEIFSSWWAGGAVVLVPRETRRDAAALCRILGEHRVDRLFLPFVALQQIAEAVAGGAPAPAGLREVFTAGEQLRITPQIAAWLERSQAVLENQYGPSEGHAVSAHRLSGPAAGWPALPPIGRPLPNVRMYLLDRCFEPVPQGVAGHLCFGGVQVIRGYLDRPRLTAGKFVPDPFGGEPGARLYATGDLARFLPDGSLQYLGRTDQQVKVRGFRVEPGEVEAALTRHPGVREAAVVARGEGADRRLVGYWVSPEPSPSPDELRAFLRSELPEYMVPADLVRLDALPLTPSGKLDRRALPEPQGGTETEHAAPADPVEELLTGIWAEVLGRGRVGVRDDFFALGGHSLLATQVVSRVRQVLGVELPLRQLFEAPTVAGFARAVRNAAGLPAAPPIGPAPRGGDLPLSFAQQRLWLLDQLQPGNPAYNMPLAMRLSGELPAGLLARIFAEIVRRHETLRTTFETRAGQPVQRVAPPSPLGLPVVDLSQLTEVERETRAAALVQEEAVRPFSLERGPLLRLTLVRLAGQEHLLLLTLHHIVSDGWSMGVLVREVAALYAAFSQGLPSPLPELPLHYADFAVWQRGWLQGPVLEAQLEHWKRRLAGAPQVLELPTDRPRPPVQTYRGRTVPFSLPPAVYAGVRELCRREGVTPFMALLAAWAVLLGRHAGQDDLLVGTPIAGRNRREIEELIGFFVNTLVLRADLSGDPSFRRLLGRGRTEALEGFNNQDLPFERLVEELVPERDLARSPLFQVLFVLQNTPSESLEIPGLRLSPAGGAATTEKFDLTLALEERDGGLSGSAGYATDLFDAATVDRLLRRFARLLSGLAAEPERRVGDLDLLTAEETLQLQTWNETAAAYALDRPLHAWIEDQAGRSPEAVAVVFEDEELTYRDLDRRANGLARQLRARGCGPESRVGVMLERSCELLVALLGILKAGAAYVPLDPDHPADRRAFQERDARLRLVLTRADLDGLDGDTPLSVPVDPDCPAYVLYTSGSTGKPKGAVISHRAITNRLLWMQDALRLTAADRVLQKTPFSFDVSVWELFWPLMTGARLVVARPGGHRDNSYLARLIAGEGITVLHFVPSMLQLFLEEPGAAECRTLRDVVCSGEALPGELARRFAARLGHARLHNLYGPTEAAVDVTFWVCEPGAGDRGSIPIGRPIANTRIHLLDPGLRLVPVGVPGELFIAGVNLARGYVERPDLTAERFLPDPLAGAPGERVYRTGDLARWREDGAIEFLGRTDHQVKIRGFRIELGEIEAVLLTLPAVREAVVLARDRRLVAYVVGDSMADALRQGLCEQLPESMVPAAFVLLPALPLTSSGKVDRKALPAPEWRNEESYAAPRTQVEEILADLWAELLGLDRVGVHDHFFALGGHSLLATQVVSRVRQVLGVEVPLRSLFEAPTVAGLAERVGEGRKVSLPPIERVSRDEVLPLSFAQERLWFIDQLEPGGSAYNVPAAVRLTGRLDRPAFAASWNEVVRRHESLRTTFEDDLGTPRQVVSADARAHLSVVDLSSLGEPELESRRLTREEARRPFDLRRGPLLRGTLVVLGESVHLVLLNMHHIVGDAWSTDLLVRELGVLYEAFCQGRPSPLPELCLQYPDYAVWQRRWLAGEVLEAQVAYWRERLEGMPQVLDLPADRPRPAVQSGAGSALRSQLPAELVDELQAFSRRNGATLFMTLLAIFQALLARHSGQRDFAVGTPIAGRDRAETEPLIGLFVNTLVMRASLSDCPGAVELLGRLRETTLSAYAHQHLPFEKLVEELAPERDLSRAPVFQVLLNLLNVGGTLVRFPGLELEPLEAGDPVARLDLALYASPGISGLHLQWVYGTDLFDAPRISRMADQLETLLRSCLAAPETPVTELPLLGEAEQQQVLGEWNDTARSWPAGCLHELFEAQADLHPEATAVVFGEEEVSYGELERRANRLAHRLREHGVGPEVRVALCVDRSPAMAAAVLGVLKAGGAYVPLDPELPPA
ncbi:MAG TPA: non-ribosomal peptide synthase/polyketide synthase, partial [Thermoanaerobaculia bacterium]|nr:non-ribosomal peptide synthase/polyketide synthase [Thermoanaerobaculia bacterium]